MERLGELVVELQRKNAERKETIEKLEIEVASTKGEVTELQSSLTDIRQGFVDHTTKIHDDIDQNMKKLREAFEEHVQGEAHTTLNTAVRDLGIKASETAISMDEVKEKLTSMDELKETLQQIESTMQSGTSTQQGTGRGYNPMNTPDSRNIDKLTKDSSKADFLHFARSVEIEIEKAVTWKELAKGFPAWRRHPTPLNSEEDVREMFTKNGLTLPITFDFNERSKEFYAFMFPKMNPAMVAVTEPARQNGFEAYRLMHQEYNFIHSKTTEFMEMEVACFQSKCKTLEGIREVINTLDRKAADYLDKSGKKIDSGLIKHALWRSVDDQTMSDIRRNGKTSVMEEYETLRIYLLEQLALHEEMRILSGGKSGIAGGLAAVSGDFDPWKRAAEDKGGCTHDDHNAQDSNTQGDAHGSLDAFNKGKGKGRDGKGPGTDGGHFFWCKGYGHRQYQCTSGDPNAQDSKQCHGCHGWGHISANCPSGKAGAPAQGGSNPKGGKAAGGKTWTAPAAWGSPFWQGGKDKGGSKGGYGKGAGPKGGKGKGFKGYGKGQPKGGLNSVEDGSWGWYQADSYFDQYDQPPSTPPGLYHGQHPGWDENGERVIASVSRDDRDPTYASSFPPIKPMCVGIKVQNRFQKLEEGPSEDQEELEDLSLSEGECEESSQLQFAPAKRTLKKEKAKANRQIKNERKIRKKQHEEKAAKEAERKFKEYGQLCCLDRVPQKGGIMSTARNDAEFVSLECTVDSAACECVMPPTLLDHIEIAESPASAAGVEYEVANSEKIPNLGERRLECLTDNSKALRRITFQVADVHKPLLCTAQLADCGFTTHLDEHGGYIEDKWSGERIPVKRRGNVYSLRLWVRQAGAGNASHEGKGGSRSFGGQGRR